MVVSHPREPFVFFVRFEEAALNHMNDGFSSFGFKERRYSQPMTAFHRSFAKQRFTDNATYALLDGIASSGRLDDSQTVSCSAAQM